MTRSEYLDEICKIVTTAIKAVGKVEAKAWLDESEEVVSHPWLDEQEKCLQILELSTNWDAFFLELLDECDPSDNIGNSFAKALENIACAAMYADCREIFDRVIEADEQVQQAKRTLIAAAHRLDNVEAEITTARREFEQDIIDEARMDAEAEGVTEEMEQIFNEAAEGTSEKAEKIFNSVVEGASEETKEIFETAAAAEKD
jgi:DNA anti-recombination protein RmuC